MHAGSKPDHGRGDDRIKVVFIVTGTQLGGAENMLCKLLTYLDQDEFECVVVSLTSDGPIAHRIRDCGIRVLSLDMDASGYDFVKGVVCLFGILRTEKPDVVQTWMYHADLLGGTAAKMATKARIFWNIRQSNLDRRLSKKSTRLVARLCARLSSRIPDRIMVCSQAASGIHARMGYARTKMEHIPNGFVIGDESQPSVSLNQVREQFGLPTDALVIGNLARFDPQKDHETFFKAAGRLANRRNNVHFVLAGQGINTANPAIRRWVEQYDLSRQVTLCGQIEDVNSFLGAVDILTVSSAYGEGFPNVLGEAMLARVICVATDVGDSARILESVGFVVPVRSPEKLCEAWLTAAGLAEEEKRARRERGRQRIVSEFDIRKVAQRYASFYRDIKIGDNDRCAA